MRTGIIAQYCKFPLDGRTQSLISADMANKTKPAHAKTHRNPKGRVAFFCYVKPKTLAAIKTAVESGAESQGAAIDAAFFTQHGVYKRPIA